jgi:hypothetical protein
MKKSEHPRIVVPREHVARVIEALHRRINERLDEKGDGSFITPQEAFGVLAGEVFELQGAIHSGTDDHQKWEWMDIAVTAVFEMASLDVRAVSQEEGK